MFVCMITSGHQVNIIARHAAQHLDTDQAQQSWRRRVKPARHVSPQHRLLIEDRQARLWCCGVDVRIAEGSPRKPLARHCGRRCGRPEARGTEARGCHANMPVVPAADLTGAGGHGL